MPSEFSAALANLDSSVQTIQSHLSRLGAALEVDDGQLDSIVKNSRQHAAMLRNLIRAERPAAHWTDRKSLERLIHELEAAAEAARNQERRNRLVELASELEAGSIRHRFDSRTAALDALRLEAVTQLRESARSAKVKDIPGPSAALWLPWACRLREASDGFVLAQLHRDFGALEHFVSQMEESYWTSTQYAAATLETAAVDSGEPSNGPAAPAFTDPDFVAPDCSKYCDTCHCTFPPDTKICPFDNSPLRPMARANSGNRGPARAEPVIAAATPEADSTSNRSEVPAYQPASLDVPSPTGGDPIDWELANLKSIWVERNSRLRLGKNLIQQKWFAGCGAVAALVLLTVILYAQGLTPSQLGNRLRVAVVEAAGVEQGPVQDSDIQKSLDQKLATLENSSIQAGVQNGVVTLVGQTSTQWDLLHAGSIAAQIEGVKQVKNELQVITPAISAVKHASGKRLN